MKDNLDRGEGLRRGYTTGACAAAAAKAAATRLLFGEASENVIASAAKQEVELLLPAGVIATFPIAKNELDGDGVRCTVIKDAGDDPDVTHGAEICAFVRRAAGREIALLGGIGVGTVTKPGLELPVGSPAINLVPRRMIAAAVREVAERAGYDGGLQVIISVPQGERLAQRTLNARLGIIGGISILGTTGIVQPMSHAAYQACIERALDVALAVGCREVALSTGRRTELFAMKQLSLPEEAFIEMGDFIGHALRACRERKFSVVNIITMVGKMTKIAAGHLHTHADAAPQSLHSLLDAARHSGVAPNVLEQLTSANTAREMSERLVAGGPTEAFNRLCVTAQRHCQSQLNPATRVRVYLCGFEGELWGKADADA